MSEQPYTKREVDLLHEVIETNMKGINKNVNSLRSEIKEVRGEMKEGFEGVYKRQDKTNGNVTKNKKNIGRINWILTVVAVFIGTLLYVNGSELLDFIVSII